MTTSTLLISAQATAAGAEMSRGLSIAASGLFIVFSALLLISLFIASLPRVLELVARVWPEVDDTHARAGHPESQVPDNTRVLAAIGYVLHTEMQRQLALEKSEASTGSNKTRWQLS